MQAEETPPYFQAHDEHIVLTDTEETATEQVFTLPGAPPMLCNDLDIEGTVLGVEQEDGTYASEDVTVGINYTGCEFSGSMTFDDDGCHYRIAAATDEEGHADIELLGCDENGGILITTEVGVHFLFPHQTIEQAAHFTNTNKTTEGREINVEATANAVAYHCTPKFVCELGGITPTGNATYTGDVEIAGYVASGAVLGEGCLSWRWALDRGCCEAAAMVGRSIGGGGRSMRCLRGRGVGGRDRRGDG